MFDLMNYSEHSFISLAGDIFGINFLAINYESACCIFF